MEKIKFTNRNKFVRLKTAKKRKLSSQKWLERQLNDPFVQQAKIDGYRSRAAYKLLEINRKFNILDKKFNVLDLGSAPGSWSQVVVDFHPKKIVAVDLLKMEEIADVNFIQGDFLEIDIQKKIENILAGEKINLILSDIAPNTIGHKDIDHLRIMVICEMILEFSQKFLSKDGSMIIKIFQGAGFTEYLNELKKQFKKVNIFKPSASRSGSPEIYIAARNKK
jgi:23S rRNA (uridine2552-2'-O)-methyltransferase